MEASQGQAAGVFIDGTHWKVLTGCHEKSCGEEQVTGVQEKGGVGATGRLLSLYRGRGGGVQPGAGSGGGRAQGEGPRPGFQV